MKFLDNRNKSHTSKIKAVFSSIKNTILRKSSAEENTKENTEKNTEEISKEFHIDEYNDGGHIINDSDQIIIDFIDYSMRFIDSRYHILGTFEIDDEFIQLIENILDMKLFNDNDEEMMIKEIIPKYLQKYERNIEMIAENKNKTLSSIITDIFNIIKYITNDIYTAYPQLSIYPKKVQTILLDFLLIKLTSILPTELNN